MAPEIYTGRGFSPNYSRIQSVARTEKDKEINRRSLLSLRAISGKIPSQAVSSNTKKGEAK
jgi:hypothetical protein